MDTRSLASVVRGAAPAVVLLADEAVVGHEHVVEEHLVEHRLAGELAQRPDVDAGRLHVDHEARDAVVLRLLGVGAGEADAPVGFLGHRRPHLLAVQHPAALDARGACVDSDARSEPAPGSLNSWHQLISPRSVGGIQRSCCSGVPCTIRVGSAHAPTPMFRADDLGGAELLFDHEQLDRVASRPHGCGQRA